MRGTKDRVTHGMILWQIKMPSKRVVGACQVIQVCVDVFETNISNFSGVSSQEISEENGK